MSELLAFHVGDGRVTTAVPDACFPGYVGDRLAYRDLDGVAHIGTRSVAGAGALTALLRQHVDQNPGPAAAVRCSPCRPRPSRSPEGPRRS